MCFENCWVTDADPKERFSTRLNETELLWADGQDGIQNLVTWFNLVKLHPVVRWDEAQCFTFLRDTLHYVF